MSLTILLRCVDLESTRNFYQSVLGFDSAVTPGNTLTVSKHGVRLVFTAQDLWALEPRLSGTIYITVVDVEACFAAIKDSVTVAWALQEMPYGSREFAIMDCNGYLIAFQQEDPGRR
jgi:predicted enzyme related to lactoylglutathione lyase